MNEVSLGSTPEIVRIVALIDADASEAELLDAWNVWRWKVTPEDAHVALRLWDAFGEDSRWFIVNAVQREYDRWDALNLADADDNPWFHLMVELLDRHEVS